MWLQLCKLAGLCGTQKIRATLFLAARCQATSNCSSSQSCKFLVMMNGNKTVFRGCWDRVFVLKEGRKERQGLANPFCAGQLNHPIGQTSPFGKESSKCNVVCTTNTVQTPTNNKHQQTPYKHRSNVSAVFYFCICPEPKRERSTSFRSVTHCICERSTLWLLDDSVL